MKKLIIDTNALISFVTDRNPAQQEIVGRFFEEASNLKLTILCHQNVLTEFVYVMEKVYLLPKEKIHEMVEDLLATPGIEIVDMLDYKHLLLFWPEKVSDFGDAVLAAFAKSRKDSDIVTFDQKFLKTARALGLKVLSFQ